MPKLQNDVKIFYQMLLKYINCVKGTDKEPKCNSFQVVMSALQDHLLLATVTFFQSLAEELELFLTEFQLDAPMAPFLHCSLIKLLKALVVTFVLKEVLESKPVNKSNVVEQHDKIFASLLNVKEIDLGYAEKRTENRPFIKEAIFYNKILNFISKFGWSNIKSALKNVLLNLCSYDIIYICNP